MANPRKFISFVARALLLTCLLAASARAQSARFGEADSAGVQATRMGSTLLLELDSSVGNTIKIPRLAAPLRLIEWTGAESSASSVSIKPEQEEWILSWETRPSEATGLKLQFDNPPLLISEIRQIVPSGDGSYWLPAHYGATAGEKIRYEPQTIKNTVGYWVGKQDSVTWTMQVDAPGQFNVGVLQGCGRGQGGSQARITVLGDGSESPQSLEFEVLETGHFQNFQWRHLGTVAMSSPGVHTLTIEPVEIRRTALMDVRAVHLVRLPALPPGDR